MANTIINFVKKEVLIVRFCLNAKSTLPIHPYKKLNTM